MAAAGDSGSSTDNNTEDTEFLECGLCYENDDLKRLPCSPGHIFCVTCLTKDSEQTKIILCPVCKRVFEDSVDALPSATAPIDEFNCCDVCRRKDEKFNYAQVYCVICAKKFCDSHLKSHNDALDDHRRIPMVEYQREYRKMETRYCEKHSGVVYSHGCENCFSVFCAECVSEYGQCPNGDWHSLVTLDRLALTLINIINEKKVWVFDKEEHLLGIVKVLTRRLSDWDSETNELIAELHNARDKQLEEIQGKYEALERQLLDSRCQSRDKMTKFLDDVVGKNLTKLTRQLLKINARVFSHHKVDVVKGYKGTDKLIDELMMMKVTEFQIQTVELVRNIIEGNSLLSVTLKASNQPILTDQQLICTSVRLPTSLRHLKSVRVSGQPISVCHHKEFTYAGLGVWSKSIVRIHENGRVDKSFIKLGGRASGLIVHKEKLYVLCTPTWGISVFDLSGKLVNTVENVNISGDHVCKFAITEDDKIVIADQARKKLTIISVVTKMVTHVPCVDMPFHCTTIAMASSDNDSVVITIKSSSKVSRVSLADGHTIWTSDVVPWPLGVVCYKNQYILVTNCERDCKIWILDVNTGQLVGEILASSGQNPTDSYDMEVNGDQLLVTNYHSQTVEYYQIS